MHFLVFLALNWMPLMMFEDCRLLILFLYGWLLIVYVFFVMHRIVHSKKILYPLFMYYYEIEDPRL